MRSTTFVSVLALSMATLVQSTPHGSSLQARTYPTTNAPQPEACTNAGGQISCCNAKYGDEVNGNVLSQVPLLGPVLSLIYGVTVNLSILPVNTKAIGIGCK
jgi:hypothetical protein